jgi:hypothetical protein
VSAEPSSVTFPGTREVAYRTVVITRETTERFSLEFAPALLPDGGAALSPAGPATVAGSGRILGGAIGVATPACSPSRNRFHGYEPQLLRVDVVVPPDSTSEIVVPYRFGAFAPWPGAPVGVQVRARRRLSDGSDGTLGVTEQRLTVPRVGVARRRSGVRIDLWTWPGSDPAAAERRPKTIRSGTSLRVVGAIRPSLRGVRIRLAYVGPRSSRLRTIAHVRTNGRGRFQYRAWRLHARGRYELWAFSPRHGQRILPDYRCPRGFQVD